MNIENRCTDEVKLDFVWVELTNQCNLQCIHCYAESGPTSIEQDILSEQDYIKIIRDIRSLGCENLQFIGGEPTLNRSLPLLIEEAHRCGFPFIEVFTNLISISDKLFNTFLKFNVALATSFYSKDPIIHDSITQRPGSFSKTVSNIHRVLSSGLRLRVGIIQMEENKDTFTETWQFLEKIGVQHIGTDRIRNIGRANGQIDCDMGELCGSCAGNILSIGPDGVVAPCNMSKAWSVGSLLDEELSEIVISPGLLSIRKKISQYAQKNNHIHAICDPKTCDPYSACCPSTQSCLPCAPNGCEPCFPKG